MKRNPAHLAGLVHDFKHPPLAGGEDNFLKSDPLKRVLVPVVGADVVANATAADDTLKNDKNT